jgi:hypothetical protein
MQTSKQANKQANKQASRQASKQANKQTKSEIRYTTIADATLWAVLMLPPDSCKTKYKLGFGR